MIDTININKGKVTKMYRNNKKIWQMPRCGIISVEGAERGSQRITVQTYPIQARVQIIIGEKIGGEKILEGETSLFGYYSLFLDEKLDAIYVEVKVEAEGFLPNSKFTRLRRES